MTEFDYNKALINSERAGVKTNCDCMSVYTNLLATFLEKMGKRLLLFV